MSDKFYGIFINDEDTWIQNSNFHQNFPTGKIEKKTDNIIIFPEINWNPISEHK